MGNSDNAKEVAHKLAEASAELGYRGRERTPESTKRFREAVAAANSIELPAQEIRRIYQANFNAGRKAAARDRAQGSKQDSSIAAPESQTQLGGNAADHLCQLLDRGVQLTIVPGSRWRVIEGVGTASRLLGSGITLDRALTSAFIRTRSR